MKKYTTLLCLLLALVMVMACFTGCAKQPAQSDPADTTEPAQTTDTTPEDSTPAEPADTRETVNIRFAQFGNNLDDLDGYANDPIKAAIEQAVGVTLEYDTGTDGFDDRMQTELFTGSAPDLFPTWGESDKIASWVQDGLVTNLGEIVNADPDRYPTLYKMMNSEEWKAYNKLYTGDETASYAIYSVAAFADPSFGGVPVYNQAILDEVNEGKVPATVDEFLTYCEAAGSAGYVGWWPRNDKLTNWNEIDATLALPQGTSITVPKGAGTGTILAGEAGTDSEYWTVSAVSEQSKAVVKQLAELYKNGGLDAHNRGKGGFGGVCRFRQRYAGRCELWLRLSRPVPRFLQERMARRPSGRFHRRSGRRSGSDLQRQLRQDLLHRHVDQLPLLYPHLLRVSRPCSRSGRVPCLQRRPGSAA